MDDPRKALLDPLRDKIEMQEIRREMDAIKRDIEILERSVHSRLEPGRNLPEDVGPDEASLLDDYRRYQAAEAQIEKRIAEIERRVAELEERYGVNVLLN